MVRPFLGGTGVALLDAEVGERLFGLRVAAYFNAALAVLSIVDGVARHASAVESVELLVDDDHLEGSAHSTVRLDLAREVTDWIHPLGAGDTRRSGDGRHLGIEPLEWSKLIPSHLHRFVEEHESTVEFAFAHVTH